MSTCLVTGAAGFIGSQLSEKLLSQGETVIGVDSMTDYYLLRQKQDNLAPLTSQKAFRHLQQEVHDLTPQDLAGVDAVFHLAGQPGVRGSWASGFSIYAYQNVVGTQAILEAATAAGVPRFVYASSSSVYGEAAKYPTTENDLPSPVSPYGVTKLAGEHLVGAYSAANPGLVTVSLRYFTVYGPRQRPDMAFHRLIEAGLTGSSFPVFGSGEQTRDFTHVQDVVQANLAAWRSDVPSGTVCNIAGGDSASLRQVIQIIEDLLEKPIRLDRRPAQPGDVMRTGGAANEARALLEWVPKWRLRAGLGDQVNWHQRRVRPTGGHW